MDNILDPIKQFISTADDQTKTTLSQKLRDLANSLETPDNTLDRITFGVSQNSLVSGRGGEGDGKTKEQVID